MKEINVFFCNKLVKKTLSIFLLLFLFILTLNHSAYCLNATCVNGTVACANGGTPYCPSYLIGASPTCGICGSGASCISEGIAASGIPCSSDTIPVPCSEPPQPVISIPTSPPLPPPPAPIITSCNLQLLSILCTPRGFIINPRTCDCDSPIKPIIPTIPTSTCDFQLLSNSCASKGFAANPATCVCVPPTMPLVPTTPIYICDPGYTSCPDNFTKGFCCPNGCCPSDPTQCKCPNGNQCIPNCSTPTTSYPSCSSSADCNVGEYCNLDTNRCSVNPNQCVAGCTNNSQCYGSFTCNSNCCTSSNLSVSPSQIGISVSGVPSNVLGLAIPIILDTSVVSLGASASSSVSGSLTITGSRSEGVGIISTSTALPSTFTIIVPLVGIMVGTSMLSTGNVLDMLGGTVIAGASISVDTNSITVSSINLFSTQQTNRYVFKLLAEGTNFDSQSSCSVDASVGALKMRVIPKVFNLDSKHNKSIIQVIIPKNLRKFLYKQASNKTITVDVSCSNGATTSKDISIGQ